MEHDLSKKVLITGASSGIGEALAYKFAQAGYSLFLTYNKNKAGADKVQAKCLEYQSPSVEFFKLDLSNDESILNFSSQIKTKIDILINNAGNTDKWSLEEITFKDIDDQIAINLNGLIKLTKELLPKILNIIVNVGSSSGLKGVRNNSVYSATKFAVRGFTKSLALERKNLKVYTANPSSVAVQRNNYRGMDVNQAAVIIFNLVIGKYKIKSGDDLNIRDYKYGRNLKPFLILARKIRNLIKL